MSVEEPFTDLGCFRVASIDMGRENFCVLVANVHVFASRFAGDVGWHRLVPSCSIEAIQPNLWEEMQTPALPEEPDPGEYEGKRPPISFVAGSSPEQGRTLWIPAEHTLSRITFLEWHKVTVTRKKASLYVPDLIDLEREDVDEVDEESNAPQVAAVMEGYMLADTFNWLTGLLEKHNVETVIIEQQVPPSWVQRTKGNLPMFVASHALRAHLVKWRSETGRRVGVDFVSPTAGHSTYDMIEAMSHAAEWGEYALQLAPRPDVGKKRKKRGAQGDSDKKVRVVECMWGLLRANQATQLYPAWAAGARQDKLDDLSDVVIQIVSFLEREDGWGRAKAWELWPRVVPAMRKRVVAQVCGEGVNVDKVMKRVQSRKKAGGKGGKRKEGVYTRPLPISKQSPEDIVAHLDQIAPKGMHVVYILAQEPHCLGAKTYVGYSNHVSQRWRQHNKFLAGGARVTSRGSWWFPVIVVGPFSSKNVALSFEKLVKVLNGPKASKMNIRPQPGAPRPASSVALWNDNLPPAVKKRIMAVQKLCNAAGWSANHPDVTEEVFQPHWMGDLTQQLMPAMLKSRQWQALQPLAGSGGDSSGSSDDEGDSSSSSDDEGDSSSSGDDSGSSNDGDSVIVLSESE